MLMEGRHLQVKLEKEEPSINHVLESINASHLASCSSWFLVGLNSQKTNNRNRKRGRVTEKEKNYTGMD